MKQLTVGFFGVFLLSLVVGCGGGGGAPPVASILVSPDNSQEDPLYAAAGSVLQFVAQAYDDGGNPTDAVVAWSTTGDIGAVDENGLFTATQTTGSDNPVTGTVVATSEDVSTSVNLAVVPGDVAAVIITPNNSVEDPLNVMAGAAVQFTAVGEDQYGNRGRVRILITPEWSLTGQIGTIAPDGLLTATQTTSSANPVTGTVVATFGDVSATVNVAVVPAEVERIVLSGPLGLDLNAIPAGSTVQFSAVGEDHYGNRALRRIFITPEWSLTGQIGSISPSGLLTATQATSSETPVPGTVVATLGEISAYLNVSVVPGMVSGIVISWPPEVNLNAVPNASTIQFSAVGEDQYGNRRNRARIAISPAWSVTGGIGTITSAGLFTATNTGTGQVVASLTQPPLTQAVSVAVLNSPPTAAFTVTPNPGTTATVFQFDASDSSDPETLTSALQVRWDWENDGIYDTSYTTVKTESHQFSTIGTKTVRLQVKDSAGATDVTTESVWVTDGTITFNYGISTPGELEVDPERPFLYIANPDGNEIKIISTVDFSEFGTISVGAGPNAMDISPDGNTLIVGLSGSQRVAVVDISDISSPAVTSFPAAVPPTYLAIAVNNKVYVSSRSSNDWMRSYNYLTGQQLGQGNSWGPLATTSDRRNLFFLNYGWSPCTLSHLDTATSGWGTLVKQVADGSNGRAVGADPLGRYVYSAYGSPTKVLVHSVSLDPDADLLIQGNIAPEAFTTCIETSPDGRYVYCGGIDKVRVYDINTFTEVYTVPNMPQPEFGRLKVTADGFWVSCIGNNGLLYVAPAYHP